MIRKSMPTLWRLWQSCRRANDFLAIALILFYQRCVAPIFIALGFGCRFYPSCSEFALTSIRFHGLAKSSFPIIRRLSRCHPWCAGGLDPVIADGKEHFSSRKLRRFHG